MRRVHSTDTAPELLVRRLTHSLGFRYRLHRKDLPGKPDLVFPSRKKIIFVHGCFWHGHKCKRGDRVPKQNREYWIKKIQTNVARDEKNFKTLKALGWSVLAIWECETRDQNDLKKRIVRFLNESDG